VTSGEKEIEEASHPQSENNSADAETSTHPLLSCRFEPATAAILQKTGLRLPTFRRHAATLSGFLVVKKFHRAQKKPNTPIKKLMGIKLQLAPARS
jgi:hypothetical protein